MDIKLVFKNHACVEINDTYISISTHMKEKVTLNWFSDELILLMIRMFSGGRAITPLIARIDESNFTNNLDDSVTMVSESFVKAKTCLFSIDQIAKKHNVFEEVTGLIFQYIDITTPDDP